MKFLRLLPLLPLIAVLASCGGKGSSAPAPTNFTVTPQDTQLYMTWDATPGVEYWVFCAPNATTIDSHSPSATHSGWYYFRNIFSGIYYATGLANGTSYACTVNGRTDSGPGGPDAAPQVKAPRYAGATTTWGPGAASSAALSGMTVNGVAYGMPSGLNLSTDQFVAVGAGGKIAVSSGVDADAKVSWAAPSQPLSDVTGPLNAVIFYPAGNRFVAVGMDGKVAYATSTSIWTSSSMSAATGISVNALANGGSYLVAVGDSGLVRTSTDGVIWTTTNATLLAAVGSTSVSPNLKSVTYASAVNGSATSPYWIAVGDGGAILKSTDGAQTWRTLASNTNQNLKSVAALAVTNSTTNITTYVLVAVGDNGTIMVSTDDGSSWTTPQSVSSVSSVAFVNVYAAKGQLMALDAGGNVFTSTDGSVWNGGFSVLVGQSAQPAVVLRYNPTLSTVSNGWMVFDATGAQRTAK
jgi:photosystem II stability/assembly factor-like uncharacterized protein